VARFNIRVIFAIGLPSRIVRPHERQCIPRTLSVGNDIGQRPRVHEAIRGGGGFVMGKVANGDSGVYGTEVDPYGYEFGCFAHVNCVCCWLLSSRESMVES
jgi:hypothetical protein